jgi:amidase
VALLEQALARMERHEAQLNAVPVRAVAQARNDALQADAALQRGERRPLLGVPITVKENFDVAGLATTVATPTSRTISRARMLWPWLRCARQEPCSSARAMCRIPGRSAKLQHHLRHQPQSLGSAAYAGRIFGGGAAAVAAGYVALELGTDIGGSVRIPAHFNGIFGHKTSYGLISMRGAGAPQGRFSARDLSVAGPLARTAQDLELALDLLLNLDPLEAKGWKFTLPPARHRQLRDFRVLVIDAWPGTDPSLSEQLVMDRLLQRLRPRA